MMKDVSVLLNLTGKFVFEKTNPLMDLVSGHGPYLYYDQLSLERFPLNQEEQDSHVQKLLINLRNLLGARRISADDQGGNIHIVVTMDLVEGFAHTGVTEVCFPAQKVCRFKEMLHRIFEKETQLLARFRYTFIFMEWDSDDKQQAAFYRSLAYDGCHEASWITSEMIAANGARDQMLENLKSPSTELSLDDSSIRYQYSVFQQKLSAQLDSAAALLTKAGVGHSFKEKVSAECLKLKTIGDIRRFDFDQLLYATVSELIGLRSSMFSDCHFFIYKMRTGTIAHRKKDEMVFYSLLQLLGTMKEAWTARLTIIDGSMNEHALDTEAMAQLKREVSSYLSKLKDGGELRWAATDHVEYQVYSEMNAKSTESNVHYEHNEEVDEERSRLYGEFDQLRRVPFFFGSNTDDWEWFTNVSNVLDEIEAYETEHDRPRYVSPGRITEKEMKVIPAKTTYADLEEIRKKLELNKTVQKGAPEASKSGDLLTDLKTYLQGRERLMADFVKYKEELKKEMVKLGIASITFRLLVLVCLIVTLCYSFHFMYTGNWAESIWIGAAFAAIALIFGVAAKISQSHFKSGIQAIFVSIGGCLNQLEKQKQSYLNKINNRVSVQNEADIRRRNLEEVKGKLELFKCHNMQVELWEKHFACLEEKLADMLNYTEKGGTPNTQTDLKADAINLHLEEIPCLPESVCRKFQSMSMTSSQGQQYQDVTCFLKNLYATFIND